MRARFNHYASQRGVSGEDLGRPAVNQGFPARIKGVSQNQHGAATRIHPENGLHRQSTGYRDRFLPATTLQIWHLRR